MGRHTDVPGPADGLRPFPEPDASYRGGIPATKRTVGWCDNVAARHTVERRFVAHSKQHLGEVEGSPALVTNLTRDNLRRGDKLILYTLTQDITAKPKVYFKRREVVPDEMTETTDGLTLISDEFADDMKGWALVHVHGKRCSTQTAVTHCTYYMQFTTEEALLTAAPSYGGLTANV